MKPNPTDAPKTNYVGDFGLMDDVNVRIDDQVKDVLAGKKSLGEVSPLVKTVLHKMRSSQR